MPEPTRRTRAPVRETSAQGKSFSLACDSRCLHLHVTALTPELGEALLRSASPLCTTSPPPLLLHIPQFPFPPSPHSQSESREERGKEGAAMAEEKRTAELPAELRYIQYSHGLEKKFLPSIRALISKDLSEPYSIYVYRYFLYQWGELCFMVLLPPFPTSSPKSPHNLLILPPPY